MNGLDKRNISVGYVAHTRVVEAGIRNHDDPIKRPGSKRFKAKYAKGLVLIRAKTADQEDYRYVLRDYKTGETIKEKVMNIPNARELNKLLRGSGIAWARC